MGQSIVQNTENGVLELSRLGDQLRILRKQLGLTAVDAARAAGISRVTLHRIEKGEASVSVGAYVSVALALGTTLELAGRTNKTGSVVPASITIDDYPGLQKLGWQIKPGTVLSALEAWDIYARNWRHLSVDSLTPSEAELVHALRLQFEASHV
jgi:transcriptional regulator with XRE-family HTH domain